MSAIAVILPKLSGIVHVIVPDELIRLLEHRVWLPKLSNFLKFNVTSLLKPLSVLNTTVASRVSSSKELVKVIPPTSSHWSNGIPVVNALRLILQ